MFSIFNANNDRGRQDAVSAASSDMQTLLPGIPADGHKLFEQYLASFPNSTQISVALIQNNSVTHCGVLKNDETLVSVENYENVFEIGSISKVFTATLLTVLVNRSIINLDENIQDKLDIKIKGNPEWHCHFLICAYVGL